MSLVDTVALSGDVAHSAKDSPGVGTHQALRRRTWGLETCLGSYTAEAQSHARLEHVEMAGVSKCGRLEADKPIHMFENRKLGAIWCARRLFDLPCIRFQIRCIAQLSVTLSLAILTSNDGAV
jgi:hypothetical protein